MQKERIKMGKCQVKQMPNAVKIQTSDMKEIAPKLRAGQMVSLTGYLYTARDAAHKRMKEYMEQGMALPFELSGACIYYAGPTPARPGKVIGACGPTTSSRMDVFSPQLLDAGLSCMIGKGQRSEKVQEALCRNGGVYLATIGGAGALIANCIKSVEVIAFPELGCESIKKLWVEDFPAFVAMDCVGGSMYDRR